jgi:Uma2 family endonuclease
VDPGRWTVSPFGSNLPVMETASSLPFTVREYLLLPDDGKQYQLIEGDFFVNPAPVPWHQTVSRRLQYELMTQLERPGIASVYNAPIDVILDDYNVLQPDLVILGAAKADLVTERAIEGVPDVVVEILSKSTSERDRYIKRRVYERFRVPEYWIVEPVHGSVHLLRHSGERYAERAVLDRSGTVTCPDFPQVSVPLAPIFQRDR